MTFLDHAQLTSGYNWYVASHYFVYNFGKYKTFFEVASMYVLHLSPIVRVTG